MYEQTTIAAIATPPGEGGIGIIRLSGIDAAEIANRMFETKKLHDFHDAVPYMMYYGKVMDNDRIVDWGLAVYMKAPHSYTGEDVVEFQMHGSVEALRSVLSLALRHGAVPAEHRPVDHDSRRQRHRRDQFRRDVDPVRRAVTAEDQEGGPHRSHRRKRRIKWQSSNWIRSESPTPTATRRTACSAV